MSWFPGKPFAGVPVAKKKKRVFLSFRAEDRQQVQGLRLLAANPDYNLEFYDESVRVAIGSRDAAYIKHPLPLHDARKAAARGVAGQRRDRARGLYWLLPNGP